MLGEVEATASTGHELMKNRHMHQPPGNGSTALVVVEKKSVGDTKDESGSEQSSDRDSVPEKATFDSAFGVFVSCLGSAAGTGNIWRFPRILATHSDPRGSLDFYIAWSILLFLWSIPLILLEYAVGRFTTNSPPAIFFKFLGHKFVWMGGWLVSVIFMLSCYYPVVLGWCFYYLYLSIASELPSEEEPSQKIFEEFTEQSWLVILCQISGFLIAAAFTLGGIKWIERANKILVPILLCIIVVTFEKLMDPFMWIAAAGQNAFDTGAGQSVLMSYAAFMPRSSGIVRLSMLIPIANNLVSFYASITLFSTAFSTMISHHPTMTRSAILRIMQTNGPGSTGLTFTWMPVLFSKFGIFGRVLCASFFFCLSIAGISSLLALIQVVVFALQDLGFSRKLSVFLSVFFGILCGIPSAMSLKVLENQDMTWGLALIISGLMLTLLPMVYGPFRFRKILINDFGTSDWNAPWIWVPLVTIIVPLEGLAMLIAWIVETISSDREWFVLRLDKLSVIFMEWFVCLLLLVIINLIVLKVKSRTYKCDNLGGCHPHKPETYLVPAVQFDRVKIVETSSNETVLEAIDSEAAADNNCLAQSTKC